MSSHRIASSKSYPKKILALIREDIESSRRQMAETIADITEDGIKYHLRKLKEAGKIKHVGPSREGHWGIISEKGKVNYE